MCWGNMGFCNGDLLSSSANDVIEVSSVSGGEMRPGKRSPSAQPACGLSLVPSGLLSARSVEQGPWERLRLQGDENKDCDQTTEPEEKFTISPMKSSPAKPRITGSEDSQAAQALQSPKPEWNRLFVKNFGDIRDPKCKK